MKLISWNVNGIRAGFNKDTFKQAFEMGADIIAVQETKCDTVQLKFMSISYDVGDCKGDYLFDIKK